jgi:hypothetical protein
MLSKNAYRLRRKIEAEGFVGPPDDDNLVKIAYGLRLAPAICLTWTVVGTGLALPFILWALVPFAALGAMLPNHPFDTIFNFGLRHLVGAPPLPHYPLFRRLVCVAATVMLLSAGWGFQAGLPVVGYSFGTLMALFAAIYVTTGFCVLSFSLRPQTYLRQFSQ